jgi:hypothetical protein
MGTLVEQRGHSILDWDMKGPDNSPAKALRFLSVCSGAWRGLLATFVIATGACFTAYVLYTVVFRAPPLAALLGNASFHRPAAVLATPIEIAVGLAVEILTVSNYYLELHFRHGTFPVLRWLIGAVTARDRSGTRLSIIPRRF